MVLDRNVSTCIILCILQVQGYDYETSDEPELTISSNGHLPRWSERHQEKSEQFFWNIVQFQSGEEHACLIHFDNYSSGSV